MFLYYNLVFFPKPDLVAYVAEIPEELVVVRLAVGEPLPLVVLVPHERFLAFGAHEVVHAPMLACGIIGCFNRFHYEMSSLMTFKEMLLVLTKRGDDPILDGPPAGPANGDAHLVVAPQAVQLVLRREDS